MNLAYIQTLLDYHYWARDIILDAVSDLPREKFTQPVDSLVNPAVEIHVGVSPPHGTAQILTGDDVTARSNEEP